MNDYKQGQLDLIKNIKNDISNLESSKEGENFLIDLVYLLKNLKPVENDYSTNNEKWAGL